MYNEKPLSQVPLRLQKMRMTLQRYDLKVTYKPGKELLMADFLSRNPVAETVDDDS